MGCRPVEVVIIWLQRAVEMPSNFILSNVLNIINSAALSLIQVVQTVG